LWERPLSEGVVRAAIAIAEAEGLCLSYSLFDRAVARCVGDSQQVMREE
jgi:tellurite resistance protein